MVDDPRKPKIPTPPTRAITERGGPSSSDRDRDRFVPKHDRGREPQFEFEDITGRYEGEALAKAREGRQTEERLAILERKSDRISALERTTGVLAVRVKGLEDKTDDIEAKVDALDGKVDVVGAKTSEIAVSVADFRGQLSIMPRLVDAMERATTELRAREHVTFTAKVDLDKAREIDEIDAKKDQRERDSKLVIERNARITKLLAILGGITTAIATAVAAGRC